MPMEGGLDDDRMRRPPGCEDVEGSGFLDLLGEAGAVLAGAESEPATSKHDRNTYLFSADENQTPC